MHAPVPAPIPSEMLLLAYRSGIFPMADAREDSELFWVEPRERAVIPLEGFRCSKSLRKALRQSRFRVTIDQAFGEVIQACAAPRPGHPESWISHRIEASYRALHEAGHAHSIECWDSTDEGEELVGGLYGVSFDRAFCGESMFSNRTDASKVALAWLVALMTRAGYRLLDCQFMTDHLASLGAVEIPQADYLDLVERASGSPECGLGEAYSSLLAEAAGSGSGAGESPSPGKLIAQSLTQTS